MLFTTPTQWIALFVALVAGWLFGLASHPGGRKWRDRYLAERDAHALTSRRAAELEADKAAWQRNALATGERVVPADTVVVDDRAPPAQPAARPAFRDPA